MDDEFPIACTLSAAQMPARLAEMTAIGRASLIGVDGDRARPTLRFRDSVTTRERLEAVVAAESVCCAFLDFDLKQRFDGLALTISGPELAAPLVGDLLDAFREGSAA